MNKGTKNTYLEWYRVYFCQFLSVQTNLMSIQHILCQNNLVTQKNLFQKAIGNGIFQNSHNVCHNVLRRPIRRFMPKIPLGNKLLESIAKSSYAKKCTPEHLCQKLN